jgi:hypothetical protein
MVKHKNVVQELDRVDNVVVKLKKRIGEQELLFTYLRKYLQDKNVRMLYKMLQV